MARTRSLGDMRTDTLRLADLENAVTSSSPRFTIAEVNEYINKGLAHVYAEMITVMDRPFFTNEQNIQIVMGFPVGTTASYPLGFDFLTILSVAWASGVNGPWIPLEPYEEADRVQLLNTGFYGGIYPVKYGITGGPNGFTQGTIPTAYSLEILPNPQIGSFLKIRYVPTCGRLVNDTDTFDGLLGFEDAAVTWAAILMRRKDDLDTTDLEGDMVKHFDRIHLVAKRRDRSRPPKIQMVRNRAGWGARRRGGFGGGWGWQ